MILDKIIVVLCLVSGTLCHKEDFSTFAENITDDSETTTLEDLSTLTDNSTTVKPTGTTDVDTKGDIIITSAPEFVTVTDTTTGSDSTVTEEKPTVVSSSTPAENTSFPDESNWTACSLTPCKNGGICQNDIINKNIYSCDCAEGYAGIHCQVTDNCLVNEDGNVCSKGACVYKKDGLSRSCKCFFGMFWDEDRKECKDPHLPCFPNPCSNGGTCVEENGNSKCICENSFEGDTCAIQNKCGEEDHCENGKCILNSKELLKYCECNSHFFWNEKSGACEAIIPPCLPNPCGNNGVCELIANGTESFKCTCTKPYVGLACEIRDFCIMGDDGKDSCKNGVCVDSKDSRKCSCKDGFYLDEVTHTCKEIIKPCFPNPCSNDGVCLPLSSNLYNCTCSEGYLGNKCTDFDYCVLNGGNAFCGEAECKNERQLGIYYCSCKSRQYFDYVSRSCIDVDFCPLIKCDVNKVCEESSCKCKAHYELNNSTGKCERHVCSPNPCPVNGLVCIESKGSRGYQCGCRKGYAFNGTHCRDGASCVFPNMNSCEQTCTSSGNETSCSCDEDYFEINEDNKTCSPIFGNATCANKTCDKGKCIITEKAEMCICPPGFTEVGGKCIDMCSAKLLPKGYCPGDQCETTSTGFKCKCEGKYVLSEDKTTCTARKMCDESEKGGSACSARSAFCVEDWHNDQGYRCQCADGKNATEDGVCRIKDFPYPRVRLQHSWQSANHDLCSIEENLKMCSKFGADCDNVNSKLSCRCPPFFQAFENGTACDRPAAFSFLLMLPLNSETYKKAQVNDGRQRRYTEKESVVDYHRIQNDVKKTIGKLLPGLLQTNVLICSESKEYILCKIELQFSLILEEDLKRVKLPQNCETIQGSGSKCLFPPSLVLQKDYISTIVTIQKTDPCDVDIKEELCGSDTRCTSSFTKPSFNCSCKAGFIARNKVYPFGDTESYIERCRDIDECSEGNPCSQNMICQNTIGSYTCSCKSGYRINDELKPNFGCVEICNPSLCVHGVCSTIGEHDFECRCDAGFTGILCNLQDANFKRAWTNTIVVGAVLGGALLVTIILSIVYTSRIKKKKYSDSPDSRLYATEMTERRNVDSGTINNAYQRD